MNIIIQQALAQGHVKETVQADLPANARVISDPLERREIFAQIIQQTGSNSDLDEMVAGSPLCVCDASALRQEFFY